MTDLPTLHQSGITPSDVFLPLPKKPQNVPATEEKR